MVNGEDSMTKLQSPIAGAAVCVLMACAAAALGQEASAVQQTAAEKDAFLSRSKRRSEVAAAAVPGPCPPRPLPPRGPRCHLPPGSSICSRPLCTWKPPEKRSERPRSASWPPARGSARLAVPRGMSRSPLPHRLPRGPTSPRQIEGLRTFAISDERAWPGVSTGSADAAATPDAAAPAGRSPWLVEEECRSRNARSVPREGPSSSPRRANHRHRQRQAH